MMMMMGRLSTKNTYSIRGGRIDRLIRLIWGSGMEKEELEK